MAHQEGYSFDKEGHVHRLDGKPLIGVTTALSVIAKPALIQWAANMAVDYLQENWDKNGQENWEALCKEARCAHRKKKEKAGEQGTDVHALVEAYVKGLIEKCDGYARQADYLPATDKGIKQFQNFIQWARENNVRFIESEKHVHNKELWIGGILDLVFEMDGKRYIGDVKTSSGIYNEHFFQMGAYELCLEEMGYEKVDGYLVINLKKDGKMDLKVAENRDINKEAFKHALGLYKIIQNLT